jgi:hypothetical protein
MAAEGGEAAYALLAVTTAPRARLNESEVMTTNSDTASRSAAAPAEQTVERSSTTLPDTGGNPVREAEGVWLAVGVLDV